MRRADRGVRPLRRRRRRPRGRRHRRRPRVLRRRRPRAAAATRSTAERGAASRAPTSTATAAGRSRCGSSSRASRSSPRSTAPAVGVGITMTLPMDVRLVAAGAKIGFVFARRGIVPEACSAWFLPRIVGISQAMEWVATGRVFDAEEAHAGGLVRSVHPADEVLPAPRARSRARSPTTPRRCRSRWRATCCGACSAPTHPLDAHLADSRAIFCARPVGRRARGRHRVPREARRGLPRPRQPDVRRRPARSRTTSPVGVAATAVRRRVTRRPASARAADRDAQRATTRERARTVRRAIVRPPRARRSVTVAGPPRSSATSARRRRAVPSRRGSSASRGRAVRAGAGPTRRAPRRGRRRLGPAEGAPRHDRVVGDERVDAGLRAAARTSAGVLSVYGTTLMPSGVGALRRTSRPATPPGETHA